MSRRSAADSTLSFLAGGGDMGARMRQFDWAKTPVGPPERWPQSLRSTVSMLLPSRAQIILFWGPEFVVLYNDAYRPVFGAKHPHALGLPGRQAWSEIWDSMLHELLEGVVRSGEAFWAKDLLFEVERYGFAEETYFDVSYDPVRVETGEVGGVFCIVTETTERVVGGRRLALLRDLAARNATARSARDACVLATETLATRPLDVRFALTYLDGVLQSSTPGAEAALARSPELVRELVVPISGTGKTATLVAGLSPHRPFDDAYRSFLDLVAGQLGTALTNALAYEQERKRAEALAEIDRAKTVFFTNVSHEFRTPLTLLLGPVQDALASPDRSLDADALATVNRNALRLLKLVNTLLDFARLEAGRAQASFEPTDLPAFTADLASAFRSAVESAGLRFDVDCAALSAPVHVDRSMWEKVVFNLLSNALKFTFDGGIRLALAQDGDAVRLSVSDTGTGIAPEHLPHLFERFHRIVGARARTHEGTGIGLALVQELVRLHGGRIAVDSEVGRGTTFTVTMPLNTGRLQAAGATPRPAPTSASAMADAYVSDALGWVGRDEAGSLNPPPDGSHSARILLADDNADMRAYAARLLGERWRVEAAADGAAALAAARRQRPDVVVADVMMPGLNGFELLAALRSDPLTQNIPVVLVSARAGEEATLEGISAGADDYLVKPFTARDLLARVDAQVTRALAREAVREALAASEARQSYLVSLGDAIRPLVAPLDVQQEAARLLGEHLGVNRALYAEVAADEDHFVIHRDFTKDAPGISGRYRLSDFGSHVREGFRAGRTLAVSDRDSDPRLDPGERVAYSALGVRAYVGVPLIKDGRLTALFGVHEHQPRQWTAEEVSLVEETAERTWAAVERARAEAALRESEEQLRDADRRKDEFLATLAHELRNPLAPIRTGLELIRLAGDTPGAVERVRDTMERQVAHMVRLIDDLLDVSRITSGKIVLQRQPTPLSSLVNSAVEAHRPAIAAKQVALSIDLPDTLCLLDVDPTRFVQVLSNLVHNAAKFTAPGGSIQVSARVVSDDLGQSRVRFAVKDTGIGISAELLPRVFDLFVQGQSDSSQTGLGIGLALARRLVEMHGGEISASSEGAGRGSEFVIFMACTDAAPVIAESRVTPGRVAHHRVLVIDDNRDGANAMAMLVEELGGVARVAYDGETGLRLLPAFRPTIVLLDIGMAGIDGYDTCRRIREQLGRSVVIVAVTGFGQAQDKARARDAGFDLHLTKPADPRQLAEILAVHPGAS